MPLKRRRHSGPRGIAPFSEAWVRSPAPELTIVGVAEILTALRLESAIGERGGFGALKADATRWACAVLDNRSLAPARAYLGADGGTLEEIRVSVMHRSGSLTLARIFLLHSPDKSGLPYVAGVAVGDRLLHVRGREVQNAGIRPDRLLEECRGLGIAVPGARNLPVFPLSCGPLSADAVRQFLDGPNGGSVGVEIEAARIAITYPTRDDLVLREMRSLIHRTRSRGVPPLAALVNILRDAGSRLPDPDDRDLWGETIEEAVRVAPSPTGAPRHP